MNDESASPSGAASGGTEALSLPPAAALQAGSLAAIGEMFGIVVPDSAAIPGSSPALPGLAPEVRQARPVQVVRQSRGGSPSGHWALPMSGRRRQRSHLRLP
jgi:hypothetical protein